MSTDEKKLQNAKDKRRKAEKNSLRSDEERQAENEKSRKRMAARSDEERKTENEKNRKRNKENRKNLRTSVEYKEG